MLSRTITTLFPPHTKNRITICAEDHTNPTFYVNPHVKLSFGLCGQVIGDIYIGQDGHIDTVYLNQNEELVSIPVDGWKSGLEVLLGGDSRYLYETILRLAE